MYIYIYRERERCIILHGDGASRRRSAWPAPSAKLESELRGRNNNKKKRKKKTEIIIIIIRRRRRRVMIITIMIIRIASFEGGLFVIIDYELVAALVVVWFVCC